MVATVKKDEEEKTIEYDTMANLMADVATQGVAGFEIVSVSAVALTVVYKKSLI